MDHPETKRLPRLAAILTQLQTKRITTAPELAKRFSVSIRTIYRDIRALEASGVPIVVEEGKGYSLMEGYKIPPVMFTESEANALILAEQLVLKNKDESLVRAYSEAIQKIKAVLRQDIKDKANLLSERTSNTLRQNTQHSSNNLTTLQFALTHFLVVKMEYVNEQGNITVREIEPFSVLSTENWLLIAWCRLREEFRYFRLDRIKQLEILPENFKPHPMTLQQFFDYHY